MSSILIPNDLCCGLVLLLHSIQSFSPMRELRADQVLALGSVVTEMGERELYDANLTDLGLLTHLGTLTEWSPRKVNFQNFHSDAMCVYSCAFSIKI